MVTVPGLVWCKGELGPKTDNDVGEEGWVQKEKWESRDKRVHPPKLLGRLSRGSGKLHSNQALKGC
jgi:hypothetical protein